MAHILRARKNANSPWVRVFSQLGWKLRNNSDTGWIQMTPQNTKIRNADNTGWLEVK